MNLYPLIRSLLFRLDPELAQSAAFALPPLACRVFFGCRLVLDPVNLMGLHFPNRLGAAAGLDKDGRHIDILGAMGFGFVEVGTTTPKAQTGNPRPRLFRLQQDQALVNRMGFNNSGVAALVDHLKKRKWQGIVGVNIGKNASTPVDRAVDDYLYCFEQVYAHASYIAINVSSPNTEGLRQFEKSERLDSLLHAIVTKRKLLQSQQVNRHVPVILKISPDLSDEELTDIASLLLKHGIDGITATNTTLSRPNEGESPPGGLSGRPLFERSTNTLRSLRKRLPENYPIVGVGGIDSPEKATEKLSSGASLLQLYTGLVFQGPSLVKACAKAGAVWSRQSVNGARA